MQVRGSCESADADLENFFELVGILLLYPAAGFYVKKLTGNSCLLTISCGFQGAEIPPNFVPLGFENPLLILPEIKEFTQFIMIFFAS